jgi:hypothetical protein
MELPPSSGITTELAFMNSPESVPSGCPETVTARRLRLLNTAIEAVSRSCDGPQGLDDCSPRRLERRHGAELTIIEQNRATAERLWLTALENGDHRAAYGLAWLRSRKALPALRQELLEEFTDFHAFPHQMTLIMAIKHISGRPLRDVVKLTPAERRMLRDLTFIRRSDACLIPPEREMSRWLLHELDGVPMRDPARDIPEGVRCRQGHPVASSA